MRTAERAPGLAVLLLLLLAGCRGQAGLLWSDRPLNALQADARLAERPLLVLICPEDDASRGCETLLEEASRPEALAWAGEALALSIGSQDPDGLRLLRLHDVRSLPCLLLFSPEGDLLVRRDGARSFSALQPDPDRPVPLEEVARLRMRELQSVRAGRERARSAPPDTDRALAAARQATERGDFQRAADILGRLDLRSLRARQVITAAETAEEAGRDDLATVFWKHFLEENPKIQARAEALGRYAGAMVRAGLEEQLEDYVFVRLQLNSQWESLSVASAVAAEGRGDLARRIAAQGLSRFPPGRDTEALRFYAGREE